MTEFAIDARHATMRMIDFRHSICHLYQEMLAYYATALLQRHRIRSRRAYCRSRKPPALAGLRRDRPPPFSAVTPASSSNRILGHRRELPAYIRAVRDTPSTAATRVDEVETYAATYSFDSF